MSIAPVDDLSSYFAAAVRHACERCAVERDPDVERYLGALLAGRAAAVESRGSIVLDLERALSCAPELRAEALRRVGDHALYTRGFFGVAPSEDPVYLHCGTLAFTHTARLAPARAPLFEALAQRFSALSNVLAEVAVAQSLGAKTRDLVRLYDAWKRSRSPSALDAMTDAGVFPSDTNGGDA
jgi:hypothetical protein